MKKIRKIISIILLQFISLVVLGAAWGGTADNPGIWFVGKGQGSLGVVDPRLRNYRWWFEAQARHVDGGVTYSQSLIRPGLGYSITDSIAVWLGYAWIRTAAKGKKRVSEQWIWQQVTWSVELSPVRFSIRTRLEQRFLENGGDTGWRFRQFLKLSYPLPFEPRLSLVSSEEIFINMNQTDWGIPSGFGQNRAFFGFGWNFDTNGHIRAEIGYLNQFIRSMSGDDQMNHILNINLLLNF